MTLTPSDIKNKNFKKKFRGFDEEEVTKFFEKLLKDYSSLYEENAKLREQLDDSEGKIKYYDDMKEALNQSILVAQEAADRLTRDAQKEADIISDNAESKARELLDNSTTKSNQILQDASEKARKITIQSNELQNQTVMIRQKLQNLLQEQLSIVNDPKWNDLITDDYQTNNKDDFTVTDLENEPDLAYSDENNQILGDGTDFFPDED